MTDQFILLGHPVGHSVSPAIHQAAYASLQRQGVYKLVDAPTRADVELQVERIRRGELKGANITVPWKTLALSLADEVASTARDVGAANVLTLSPEGRVVAHNSDALALADELKSAAAALSQAAGAVALVLGAGGAARAAVVSAQLAGATKVYVSARRYQLELQPELWPNREAFESIGAELLAWPDPLAESDPWSEVLQKGSFVIQATSAGMKGSPGGEELAALVRFEEREDLIAVDLIYNPRVTPFLREAAEHGHIARGGLGMLVGQAARAVEIWWGELPALSPLQHAAEVAMAAQELKSQ